MKLRLPLLLFLFSLPICFFCHGLLSHLVIKNYIRTNESLLGSFVAYFEYSWIRGGLYIIVTVIMPVFVALRMIMKQLSSNTPRRVFYVTVPILSLLYISLKSMSVIYVLLVGAPSYLPISFLPAIIFIPFSFVLVWLLTVTLLLYRRYH